MSILNAFRKSGGGFLNGVDAVILGVQLTTDPDFGGEARQQTERADKSTPLWAKLTVQQDGSETTDSTHLDAGAADDFVISDDGLSIEPVGDAKLWGNTSLMKLVESYADKGGDMPEWVPGTPISFAFLIGQRVRFAQEVDKERMERSVKAFAANKGKTRQYYNAAGQKKGKDGKYYDQKTLVVTEVYGKVDVKAAGANVSAKKATTKPATNGSGKAIAAAKQQVATVSSDVRANAIEALVTILGNAKDNKVTKSGMNYAITKLYTTSEFKSRVEERDPVRKFLYDDANLEALASEGIRFDKSSKDQTIALA